MRVLVVQESDWEAVGTHDSHHLLERLSKDGHEIRVIDHEVRWKDHRMEGVIARRRVKEVTKVLEGGEVTVITPSFLRAPIFDYLSLLPSHRREIARQMDEFRPDIVMGLGIINTRMAFEMARKRNIPIIYYILDELHKLVPQTYLQPLAKRVESVNMGIADVVIATNNAMEDYVREMGARRSIVIRHGVDLSRFDPGLRVPFRKKLGFEDKDMVLCFMGWLYEFSGLTEVARALASSDQVNIKLLVLGDGELMGPLKRLRDEDGRGRIVLTGKMPYNELPGYLAASDICLLPSHDVPLMRNIVPIKVLEYMAAGKPVIARDLPGIRKEFGEDSGIVYITDPGETVRKALDIRGSGRIGQLGDMADRAVRGNDWAVQYRGFKDLLISLVQGKEGLSSSQEESTGQL